MPLQPLDFVLLALTRSEQEEIEATIADEVIYDDLATQLAELSYAYQGFDPEQRLVPAMSHPGYLVGEFGQWEVFVPWTLVKWFPDREMTLALIDIGSKLAMELADNLCISGSSAYLGGEITVGDIDFSQYVACPASTIAADIGRYDDMTPIFYLYGMSYNFGKRWESAQRPWNETRSKLVSTMLSHTSIDFAGRFLADFLVRAESLGFLPASIVILPCDPEDRSRGAASRSFVFQEAVAVRLSTSDRVGAPVWELVDERQLAAYIQFLRKQIDYYRTKSPLKAVKRGLSLASTVRLHDLANEAMDILESPQATDYVRKQREELVRNLVVEHYPDAAELSDGFWIEMPVDELHLDDMELLPWRAARFIEKLDAEWKRLEEEIKPASRGDAP